MSSSPKLTWYTYNSNCASSYMFYPVPMMGFSGFGNIGNYSDRDCEIVIVKQKKVTIGISEGYECTDCKDFYPFAELNQPDNATAFTSFTCYGCRKGLKTIFEK